MTTDATTTQAQTTEEVRQAGLRQVARAAAKLLTRAKEVIADPASWMTVGYANNAEGEHVFPNDEDAVRFCGVGAIYRAAGMADVSEMTRCAEAQTAVNAMAKAITGQTAEGPYYAVRTIWSFNDAKARTHKEVIDAFNNAIGMLNEASR